MALNAKMEEHGRGSKCRTKDRHDDFECRTEDVASNAKLKVWLWTPNWKCGSERQTEDMAMKAEQKKSNGFERQDEDITLNAKWKRWSRCRTRGKQQLWTPNKKWIMTLSVKINMWLWMPNRKCDGSGCQNEKSGSERQTEDEQWLWMPNRKWL